MARYIVALIIIIAVVVGGYFAYGNTNRAPEQTPTATGDTSAPEGKLMSVEAYVTQNISTLSPVKETLGGTFYVTEIKVEPEERKGHVKYEDGHMAYEADFTYTSNDRTGHTITSFVIRD